MGTNECVTALPVNGRVVFVDSCISHLVAALNAAGLETVASCCGHGKIDGSIILRDGREVVVRMWAPPLDIAEQNILDAEYLVAEAKGRLGLARQRAGSDGGGRK